MGKLKKLKKFNAAANHLDGVLPKTIGDLDELEDLNLGMKYKLFFF